MPLAPHSRNISRIWYFAASIGSMPAMIWPVMMPGRVMMPAADIWLMLGTMPRRTDSRNSDENAWRAGAPSASRASIASLSRRTPDSMPSSARLAALSTLPSTMPISAIV
ncbi:hypothetical protein D9M72_414440 [compost metagenome]